MRASKETADAARNDLDLIEERFEGRIYGPVADAFRHVREFLNAARRKLPTDAAYERDRRRKK